MVRSEMYFCQFGIPLSRNQFNNLSSWSITAAAHDCMMKGYYARLCGHSPYTLLIGSISERMGNTRCYVGTAHDDSGVTARLPRYPTMPMAHHIRVETAV